MSEKERFFKVIVRAYPKYGKIGKLVGDINYCGCLNGWHTLEFNGDPNNCGMFAGEELTEVFPSDGGRG